MHLDFKRLAKHSAVYTAGNLLTKLAGFLLLPLYTHYLSPADYGTLELLQLAVPAIATFIGMGFSQAAVRFYYESDDPDYRCSVVSTAYFAGVVFSLAGAVAMGLLAEDFSRLLFDSVDYAPMFWLVAVALFLEMSMEVPLSYIRVREMSIFYVSVSLARLLIAIALNVLFLVFMGMGIEGILYSNIISAGLEFIVLSHATLKYSGLRLARAVLAPMWRYGFPLIFSGYGMIVLRMVDRYFLSLFESLEAVGIYSVSLKFATLLSLGIISPLWRGYGPFRFSVMDKPDARQIYSRALRYYLILVGWCGLGLALFSREAIIVMTNERFWAAYDTIPFLVLAALFYGLYYMSQTGIYLHKKTRFVAYIVSAVAVFHVGISWYLIPIFGSQGAAASVAISFLLLAIVTNLVSQKMYRIVYERGRNLMVFAVTLLCFGVGYLVVMENLLLSLLFKSAIMLLFPVLILLLGGVTREERDYVMLRLRRLRGATGQ